jgi:C7-cyclitol 7-kinase
MTDSGAKRCLVFDVGGTSIRAGLFEAHGNTLRNAVRRPTPSHWMSRAGTAAEIEASVLRELESLGQCVCGGDAPDVVVVAFAGPVDPHGVVYTAPTVHGAAGFGAFRPAEALAGAWPAAEIRVLNDVTAAGYFYRRDAHEDFCIVTVSSGIGHKLFISGCPVTGPAGRGGEIGHWVVDERPGALVCECGGQGHLGAIASGRGALMTARARAVHDAEAFRRSALAAEGYTAESLDNEALATAFLAGDVWAERVIEYGAEFLGAALAAIHLMAGVERFVIVGGFGLALDEPYRRLLVRAAASRCWDLGQHWDTMIEMGERGDHPALIGAGLFASGVKPLIRGAGVGMRRR